MFVNFLIKCCFINTAVLNCIYYSKEVFEFLRVYTAKFFGKCIFRVHLMKCKIITWNWTVKRALIKSPHFGVIWWRQNSFLIL